MLCCGKCWCVYKDIGSYIAVPISLLQILFTDFCTLRFVIYPTYGFNFEGIAMMILILFFTFMVVWSWLKSSFTEPGLVMDAREVTEEERDIYLAETAYNYCPKCNHLKPFRAHHCSKCDACILKMDHHCPWINNCVGARNQKFFVLFLIYVHMGEMLASVLGGWQVYSHFAFIRRNTDFVYLRRFYPLNRYLPNWMLDHLIIPVFHARVVPYVFLFIEVVVSFVFAIFVIFLLYDQVRSIRYDLTYVEYLKQYHIKTAENTFYDCLVSMMGEPPCWRWLLPIEGEFLDAVIKKLSHEFMMFNGDDSSSDEDDYYLEQKKNQ